MPANSRLLKPRLKYVFLPGFGCLACLSLASLSAQTITLTPTRGHPRSETVVSGSGFPAGAKIDVYFAAAQETVTTAQPDGSFSVPISIPGWAQPGDHVVSVVAPPQRAFR
jgi:hypothetical protein